MKVSHSDIKTGTMSRLVMRLRLLACSIFGHSFSDWDMIKFRIECEGRRYTVDALTGERRPWEGIPEIKCRRCGECFLYNAQVEAPAAPEPEKEQKTDSGLHVAACSLEDFSTEAAAFMSSCLAMLLEHGISPLHEVGARQMWEELTASLILAGKMPPLEMWGEESGIQGRIEAGLRDLQERFRRREEHYLDALHMSQGSADNVEIIEIRNPYPGKIEVVYMTTDGRPPHPDSGAVKSGIVAPGLAGTHVEFSPTLLIIKNS